MASLQEVFEDLKRQVEQGQCKKGSNGLCYADKILKIPGLRNLTIKVSYGSDGHYFMSLFRGARISKQITVYADDAEDFQIISAFLRKYADTISKYVKRSTGRRTSNREVEVDLDENESQSTNESENENVEEKKSSGKKTTKPKRVNVEDEF